MEAPFNWRRGPRCSFQLTKDGGVYALFLRKGVALAGAPAGRNGLIYIGMARGKGGFKQRCHFDGWTVNHSPRKSLAVLLMRDLALTPVLVTKPNAPSTWGLDRPSDLRLTAWMHDNLELAIEACTNAETRETELVSRFAPPLNLSKCRQNSHHLAISAARSDVLANLTLDSASRQSSPARTKNPATVSQPQSALSGYVTAVMIADEFGLDPKRLRSALRGEIDGHARHQRWTATRSSPEHEAMLDVARRLAGRCR